MNTDIISYYKDRAPEYEKIYAKPERQNDLLTLTHLLQDIFKNKDLLEIACGTGYWTERIALTANSVLANDINPTVVEIARQKEFARNNVSFEIRDLFEPQPVKKFDHLFGGFVWSHIRTEDISEFINTIHDSLKPGSRVVFADNNFVENSSTPITRTDVYGNTYQQRHLADGSEHEVLKNFPSDKFLKDALNGLSTDLTITRLKYFWLLTYKTS